MGVRIWGALAAGALLCGCAVQGGDADGAAVSVPVAAVPNVYVMRHLQKADGGADPALSEEGRRNAERLVAQFAGDPPAAIYVSRYVRSRETAAPLAAALGIAPKVYDPGDPAALVAAVGAERGTVLIVGHSNTVADIVARLGGTRPAELAETEFGDIFHVSGPERTTTRSRLGD
jgi:phosphohistidine phosphatase SixA